MQVPATSAVTRYTYQHAMEAESGIVHYVHVHAINVFCGAYFSGIATIVSSDNE